jgi:hypothetical protein
MSAAEALPPRWAQVTPLIVSVQPSTLDLVPPLTVKALLPVLVMPAPRQTTSSSNMNHDFFPVSVTPTPLNCMPVAP